MYKKNLLKFTCHKILHQILASLVRLRLVDYKSLCIRNLQYLLIRPDIRLSSQPDIRQMNPNIRPDTGYKKWPIIRYNLFVFGEYCSLLTAAARRLNSLTAEVLVSTGRINGTFSSSGCSTENKNLFLNFEDFIFLKYT